MTALLGGSVLLIAVSAAALVYGWVNGEDTFIWTSIGATAGAAILVVIAYIRSSKEPVVVAADSGRGPASQEQPMQAQKETPAKETPAKEQPTQVQPAAGEGEDATTSQPAAGEEAKATEDEPEASDEQPPAAESTPDENGGTDDDGNENGGDDNDGSKTAT